MCISSDGINKYLKQKKKIIYLDEVDSTNNALKAMAQKGEEEGTLIVTEYQTCGKGRLGKKFFSPKGCGLYFSLLLRPNLAPADSVYITVAAAVAVRRAVKNLLNIDAEIKWVNDIYHNGKKFCGILTEGATDPVLHKLLYGILGIGINLKTPPENYPEEFAYKTTSLSEIIGKIPNDFKNKLIAEVITQFDVMYKNLEKKDYMIEYKNASCILGKKIEILTGEFAGEALAVDIDTNANLTVKLKNGKFASLGSGDVSICI